MQEITIRMIAQIGKELWKRLNYMCLFRNREISYDSLISQWSLVCQRCEGTWGGERVSNRTIYFHLDQAKDDQILKAWMKWLNQEASRHNDILSCADNESKPLIRHVRTPFKSIIKIKSIISRWRWTIRLWIAHLSLEHPGMPELMLPLLNESLLNNWPSCHIRRFVPTTVWWHLVHW